MTTAVDLNVARQRLGKWLKDEFSWQQLVVSVNAAIILFLLEIIITLSLAALIFSGRLAAYLPQVISFVILGDAVMVATVAALSSYSGSIAVVQDAPSVVLALAAASIASGLPDPNNSAQLFSTVLVLIVGSTLAMGIVYLALGVFKLGGLVRFLPYPVMGGFLAGTGWLLTVGGIGVTTNARLGFGLFQPAVLVHWAPAVLLGLVMLLAVDRWKHPLLLAAIFVIGLAAFYALAGVFGVRPSELTTNGWLLGSIPQGWAWHFPLNAQTLSQVYWPALFSAVPVAAPAIFISLMALLLNASSLELVVKRDIGLNRELVVAGAANLAAGLAGGIMGYHSISASTLGHTLGRGKRLPGLLVSLLLILTLFGASLFLAYIPRLLLGAMLAYIGLAIMGEWLIQAWFTFPKIDYAIIVAILITIALKGFLWGIGLGLVMTVILFVVNYSRVSVIQYELSGDCYQSRVNRSLSQSQFLRTHGSQLLILKLRGFIFFGTAIQLFEHVRASVAQASQAPVHFILVDFKQVSGVDSTGRLSFGKMLQFARESNIELVLTGMTDQLRGQLKLRGSTGPSDGPHLMADMDRGVEWCEDQILASFQTPARADAGLGDQLYAIYPDQAGIAALLQFMQRRDVAAGEHLMRQGDEPNELFIIEAGQVSAQLETPGSVPVRLETMQGGRVVGELGFFLGTRRNASVIVDRPSVVYSLSRETWDQIASTDPKIAQTLNGLIINLLGQRVLHLTRVVDALQR